MRVLVTGAGGQLGLDLLESFAEDDVIGVTHGDLDITDEDAVNSEVRQHEPDLLINAAAWTDVDGCEQDPDRAHLVNAIGPWLVARACRRLDTVMAHLSSDYVFGGHRSHAPDRPSRPYTEFDPVDPVNEYGRSKAAGERLVRSTLHRHFIIRTSWLCSPRGSNFVTKILRIGAERGEANVVNDQVGSPTFTRDLARAMRNITRSDRYGTYNRTNTGTCTWFELARSTFEFAGLEVDLTPISSAELDRLAPRPSYSVLSPRHSTATGFAPLPHWRDGLHGMLRELGE